MQNIKVFYSKKIESIEMMKDIIRSLEQLYNEKEITFREIPKDFNFNSYYYIKSHRSNVTEGNTTTLGEFTELVKERIEGNLNYIIPNKIHDETLEIDNLFKVYNYLATQKVENYDFKLLRNCHSILGKDVIRMVEFRGKFKKQRNFVPFEKEGISYCKYFSEPDIVIKELDWLFTNFSKISDDNIGIVFGKYMVLQLELIAIHPFNDGNGRISRALSESYFESFGYLPYNPYSEKFKKNYQNEMAKFSLQSLDNLKSAYYNFANYILDDYTQNISETLNSIDKLDDKLYDKL